jgi:hypothetical protein
MRAWSRYQGRRFALPILALGNLAPVVVAGLVDQAEFEFRYRIGGALFLVLFVGAPAWAIAAVAWRALRHQRIPAAIRLPIAEVVAAVVIIAAIGVGSEEVFEVVIVARVADGLLRGLLLEPARPPTDES